MTFHDVIRHLVEHGPFASDADRDAARAAVDEHEAQAHAAVTSVQLVQAPAATATAAVPLGQLPGSAGAGEPAAQ